jgi:hypothetical protein
MAQQPQPVGIFLIPEDSIVMKSIYYRIHKKLIVEDPLLHLSQISLISLQRVKTQRQVAFT